MSLPQRTSWGRLLTTAVGMMNVGGWMWAMADGYGNGVIDVSLGAAIPALAVVASPRVASSSTPQG
jgi:hypothetical protein